MNINLSRELWKDVKIPFLDSLYGVVPSKLIVFVLTFFWSVGNVIGFFIFRGV